MLKKLFVFLLFTELIGVFFYKDFLQDNYQVHFIDVGQGDATLVQAPYGCQIIIDGGKPNTLSDQIHKFFPSTKRKINLMIATHPDVDHYGGLQQIADRYEVINTFITNHSKTNQQYQNFLQTLLNQNSNITYHNQDTNYLLCGLQIQVLKLSSQTSNGSSVITLFNFPDQTKLLLAGDIEKHEEHKFLQKYPNIHVDIFKANHHGSKTSNTKPFLRSIQPKYTIISSGKDNQFGHPHSNVLHNFSQLDIQVLRTDLHGTISFFF